MRIRSVLLAVGLALVAAAPCAAVPLDTRTPLLPGTTTLAPQVAEFSFEHWFALGAAPVYKITNTPTFDLGYGVDSSTQVGIRYESFSQIVPATPNDFEPYVRYHMLGMTDSPLSLAVQASYATAPGSGDLETDLDSHLGPLTGLLTLRGMSDGYGQGHQGAVGAGIICRIRHFTLQADLVQVLTLPGSIAAWSVAAAAPLPGSPHTLALEITNATGDTLEGSSLGTLGWRVGFAFTIPIYSVAAFQDLFDPDSDQSGSPRMHGLTASYSPGGPRRPPA